VNKLGEPIPFFVVDRPMSLKLLKYCEIDKLPFKVGLMGHSNTSKNFQKLFRDFEGDNIVKMADSGVFTKDGNLVEDYENLFKIYEYMGVEYGIMIDVLKNKEKTIEKAKEAIDIYEKVSPSFKLVGVAQGKTVSEYLECYKELKKLRFTHIAIGGLLKKIENSSRYVKVRDENFLEDVVKAIRKEYPKDWLFLLGCYHPKRHNFLKKYKIFGADYKGWILNYQNPNQKINKIMRKLDKIEEKKNIKNKKLSKLKSEYKLAKNNDELKKIAESLTEFRLKISKNIKEQEYEKLCLEIKKILKMSRDELREDRFKQIKNYLENNIFQKIAKRKLLIISCSAKKIYVRKPKPALLVYDGPIYRMLRKIILDNKNFNNINNLDIRIISANYGLITPETQIEYYDLKVNKDNLNDLNKKVLTSLKQLFQNNNYSEIFINLGSDYREVIKGFESYITSECKVEYAEGKIGQKLAKTKEWLLKNILSP